MHSKLVLQSMIDNGFLDSQSHNPVDYITYCRRAAEEIEAALAKLSDPGAVAEVVATMFDNGFCDRTRFPDPSEWISFATQACQELGGVG
jgi:hypothetical protein